MFSFVVVERRCIWSGDSGEMRWGEGVGWPW